uniref:Reverse transcriptase domain-containing protein n=1 Tax=Tanacetum cinerariifolium TaxID=118510 RepID=A0A6L2LTX2_TANCI|nr:reverse transcriptase domain-containing protein [Tanacetum cinerariifolium]
MLTTIDMIGQSGTRALEHPAMRAKAKSPKQMNVVIVNLLTNFATSLVYHGALLLKSSSSNIHGGKSGNKLKRPNLPFGLRRKMILDLPALTTLLPKETLFVYLAASKEAVSAVLLVVRKGKQYPIHYISRTLHDAKCNYALLEKMVLVLRHVSRRLRRYFEAHPIIVITDQPIMQILSKANTSGKLAQYSVEENLLSKLASVAFNYLTKETLVETLDVSSMDIEEINPIVEEEGETWMNPIINCLERGVWLEYQNKARALWMKIVGNGCVRNTPKSLKKSKIHNCGCGLFHKVDRSQADGQDDGKGSKEVREEHHCLQQKLATDQTMMIKEGKGNEEEMRLNLDLLTKRRKAAAIREVRYKMKMEQYYKKMVCPMSLKVGEYVYRNNEASRVENLGKLFPKWEGPYLVVEAYQNGSYKLRTMNDREVFSDM